MTAVEAVLLPVGIDSYAVPMAWMREVLKLAALAVTPLVTAPAVVLGLINLRGEIVPLLDTAALLGVGRQHAPGFAAVLHTPYGPVGLAATALPERGTLAERIGQSELAGTVGTYRLGRRVAVLLDPAVLLAPEHLGEPAMRVR